MFTVRFNFSVTHISEDQARQALLKEVRKYCCYGKGAATGMEITKIIPSNAMHVRESIPPASFTDLPVCFASKVH